MALLIRQTARPVRPTYAKLAVLPAVFSLLSCSNEPLGEARLVVRDDQDQPVQVVTWLHQDTLPALQLYTEAEVALTEDGSPTLIQLQIELPPSDLNTDQDPPELSYFEQAENGEVRRFVTTAADVLWLDNLYNSCACQGVRLAAEFRHPGPDRRDNTDDDLVRRIDDAVLTGGVEGCAPTTKPDLVADQLQLHVYEDCGHPARPTYDYDVDDQQIATTDHVDVVTTVTVYDCARWNGCYDDYDYDYDEDYDEDYVYAGSSVGCGASSGCGSSYNDYDDGYDSGGCGSGGSSGCESDDADSSGCESDTADSTACEVHPRRGRPQRHPLSGAMQNYLLIGLAIIILRLRR